MNNTSGYYQKRVKYRTQSRILLLIAIFLFASLLFIINAKLQTEAEKIIKDDIITQLTEQAENANLQDVSIIIQSKSKEYKWYNVVVECSNLSNFTYEQLFEIDRKLDHEKAYITSYISDGITYDIYPSTRSIYKNGRQVYDDYENSSVHKSSQYSGFHNTRPGSAAESIEKDAAAVKCIKCGKHSTNGVNSLCDSCRQKENR